MMIHGKLSGASGGDKTASLPSWRQTTRDATREVWRSEPIRIKLVLLDPVFEDSDEAVGSCCVLRLDNGSPLVTASAVESCTSAKSNVSRCQVTGHSATLTPTPDFNLYSEERMIGMESGFTVQNFTDFVSESVHRPLIWKFSVGAPSDSAR